MNRGETNSLPLLNQMAGPALFLYFVSILLTYIMTAGFRQGLFYMTTALCVGIFIVWKARNETPVVNMDIVLFACLCMVTGLLNFVLIGNITLKKLLECAFLNTATAAMLIEMKFNRKWLLYSVYIYCVHFAIKFVTTGLDVRVLPRYSNNFISLIIIMPTVIYYAVSEAYGDKISYIPAFCVWVICLLAKGRSGIGAATILFALIFVYVETRRERSGYKRPAVLILKALYRLLILLFLAAAVYLVFSRFSAVITKKFTKSGTDNTERAIIWKDYFTNMIGQIRYVLFGTSKEGLILENLYEGNAHNSFINIHMYNGLLVIIVVLYLIRAVIFALRKKRWVFLICMAAYCFRGSFDNVFWCTKGTTMLMYFMFFPVLFTAAQPKKLPVSRSAPPSKPRQLPSPAPLSPAVPEPLTATCSSPLSPAARNH